MRFTPEIRASHAWPIGTTCAAIVAMTTSVGAREECREWRGLGSPPGPRNAVMALTTWDPDGPGPQPTCLVAGGHLFQRPDLNCTLVVLGCVAMWDGERWSSLNSRVTGPVRALTTWDPDGPGPLRSMLVVGGRFRSAGRNDTSAELDGCRVEAYDGVEWRRLGGVFTDNEYGAYLSALASWDPDDSGPAPPRLVAGGDFTTAGGVSANNYAAWDGESWRALGEPWPAWSPSWAPTKLETWDMDGAGPQPRALVAPSWGGAPMGIGVFTPSGWSAISAFALACQGTSPADPMTMTIWDPDGAGGAPERMVIGGSFSEVDGRPMNGVAQWDGAAWSAMGEGLTAPLEWWGWCYPKLWGPAVVSALTTWDPDGAGPASARLIAAGIFTNSGGEPMSGVAAWDGERWTGLGEGPVGVEALQAWDPDGAGPEAARLVAGGWLTRAGEFMVNDTAVWGRCGPDCPGDIDGDASITIYDLAWVLALMGYEVFDTPVDLNADGVVDFLDLNIVLGAFGTAC